MSEKIAADTLEFIRTFFKSVWALELLLLMRREGSRVWSVGELIHELRASELVVKGILPEFVAKGIVAETGGGMFQYHPAGAAIEQLINRVAAAYADNRIGVMDQIFSTPNENIVTFADAFRFKKR